MNLHSVISLVHMDIDEVIDITKIVGYGVIFDAREIGDKNRITVSPYEIGGICGENGLLYIDQLVFGEDLSPEICMVSNDQMDEWWCRAFIKWFSGIGVVFLTSATAKSIARWDCLAQRIVKRVNAYQSC